MSSRHPGASTSAAVDLRESRLLTGLMITLGLNALAWSTPAPSFAAVSFVMLCFTLALTEHRLASARSRRASARASEELDR